MRCKGHDQDILGQSRLLGLKVTTLAQPSAIAMAWEMCKKVSTFLVLIFVYINLATSRNEGIGGTSQYYHSTYTCSEIHTVPNNHYSTYQ